MLSELAIQFGGMPCPDSVILLSYGLFKPHTGFIRGGRRKNCRDCQKEKAMRFTHRSRC